MSWTYATLLALLTALLALNWSPEAESAAVHGSTTSPRAAPLRRVFMKEAEASAFFRRSRRAAKSQDELNAEQRQVLAADERRREFHEKKRNELESHSKEDSDEQNEGSRESSEQWREFHYDGMHPPHE